MEREAREVGEKAVQFALWHDLDGSVTIQRSGSYAVEYRLAPLEEIAAKTRHMPDEFINDEGNDVTEVFQSYVLPLLGSELGSAQRLRAPRVPKLLHKGA